MAYKMARTWEMQPSEFWELSPTEFWWEFDMRVESSRRIKGMTAERLGKSNPFSEGEWEAARLEHREKMSGNAVSN